MMPIDAAKLRPAEKAILTALYRWQNDPPARMEVFNEQPCERRWPIPSVPYTFLKAELRADDGEDQLRNHLRILEKLALIHKRVSSGPMVEAGDEDCDEPYAGPYVGPCLGLWRLADGRYLNYRTSDSCYERHQHKVKECVVIDSTGGEFYELADSALPIVRELLLSEDDRRAGRRSEADKLRDLLEAIKTLGKDNQGKDALPDTVIAEAHIAKQEARKLLRELEAAGEYSGFSRPAPRSVP